MSSEAETKTWHQLSPSVQKQIIKEGSSFEQPSLGCTCLANIWSSTEPNLVTVPNTVLKEAGFPIGDRVEMTLGMAESAVQRLTEDCLMTMQPGEKSMFKLNLKDNSFNLKGLITEIGDDWVNIDLELLEINNSSKQLWNMSPEEKFNVGLFHKERGNTFFKDDKIEAAFYQYSTAAKYLISIPAYSPVLLPINNITEQDREKYNKLKCVCFLNLAACQAKVSNQDGVIANTSQALTIDPSNVKGLYRRAQGYFALGKTASAREDLMKARKLEPRNRAVIDLLNQCTQT